MANGLELLAPFNEPPKNEAVEKFKAYLDDVKKKIADPKKVGGKGNWSFRRSGGIVEVKLLGQIRYVPNDKVAKLLDDLKKAAEDERDTEFRAIIEAYPGSALPAAAPDTGTDTGTEKKKPKADQTGQDNGIDRSID